MNCMFVMFGFIKLDFALTINRTMFQNCRFILLSVDWIYVSASERHHNQAIVSGVRIQTTHTLSAL